VACSGVPASVKGLACGPTEQNDRCHRDQSPYDKVGIDLCLGNRPFIKCAKSVQQ
jgi:hypothetical protein